MSLSEIFKSAEEKMKKAVESVEHEFGTLRTGRASVALVDSVQVDAYGTKSPLKAVATISTPDAKTIMLQPFDKSLMGAIEKAILAANLGFTPNNDGKLIRLSIPPLTEDRRKELVKVAKHMAETGRVAVRNIRRHANDEVKKIEKSHEIAEDDKVKAEKKVQELTDATVKHIDTLLHSKEKDILEV